MKEDENSVDIKYAIQTHAADLEVSRAQPEPVDESCNGN